MWLERVKGLAVLKFVEVGVADVHSEDANEELVVFIFEVSFDLLVDDGAKGKLLRIILRYVQPPTPLLDQLREVFKPLDLAIFDDLHRFNLRLSGMLIRLAQLILIDLVNAHIVKSDADAHVELERVLKPLELFRGGRQLRAVLIYLLKLFMVHLVFI